jgi:hypothetical protein
MTRNRFLLLGAIVPGLFGLVMMAPPEMILRHNLMARITTIDAKRSRQNRQPLMLNGESKNENLG